MEYIVTDFFGINEGPFKRSPDLDYFYPSDTHTDALIILRSLLVSNDIFAVVTGKPGAGKSITLKKLISELHYNKTVFSYISFPNLSIKELIKAILYDLSIPFDLSDDIVELHRKVINFLTELRQNDRQLLLIIDEAQNIPVETLEELRLLGESYKYDTSTFKIILSGQPELNHKLSTPELRQLTQRIRLRYNIKPLSLSDCQSYIIFRMNKDTRHIISIPKAVLKQIWYHSEGNPRLINTIMEKTIIAAFMDATKEISKSHLKSALKSINYINNKEISDYRLIAVIMIVIFIAAAGIHKFNINNPFKKTLEAIGTIEDSTIAENDRYSSEQISSNENNIILDNTTAEANSINNDVLEEQKNNIAPSEGEGTVEDTDNEYSNVTEIQEPIQAIEADIAQGRVISRNLNVRSLPTTSSHILISLKFGDTINIIGENEYWYEIKMKDGTKAWVYKDFIEKTKR